MLENILGGAATAPLLITEKKDENIIDSIIHHRPAMK